MCTEQPNKSSPHSQGIRLVIALLSPDEIFETGLRTGASEKRVTKLGFGVNVDIFSSPVCGQNSRNWADFSRFPEKYT
jgi:hypothetical protein